MKVGKALSAWHKKRMVENAKLGIDPVMKENQRQAAIGSQNDFCDDIVTTYMTRYAEEIFEPKRVLQSTEWLAMQREPDQYFSSYKAGKWNIKWVKPG